MRMFVGGWVCMAADCMQLRWRWVCVAWGPLHRSHGVLGKGRIGPQPRGVYPTDVDTLPGVVQVVDLDKTLVFTEFKVSRGFRTIKRPGVDFFLDWASKNFAEVGSRPRACTRGCWCVIMPCGGVLVL